MGQRVGDEGFPIIGVVQGPPLKRLDRVLQRWRIAKVKRYIRQGARVLDIGCADGALFRQLKHRIGVGVGVDPALEKSVGGGRFRLVAGHLPTDLTSIGQFDAITMLAVVEHLPDEVLTQLRDQCIALLKPGGVILITVPSVQIDRILDWLTKARLIAGMSLHEHHGFDPSSVPSWFSGNGLTVVAARRFQLGLNNLFVFRKEASAGASAETATSVPVATRG